MSQIEAVESRARDPVEVPSTPSQQVKQVGIPKPSPNTKYLHITPPFIFINSSLTSSPNLLQNSINLILIFQFQHFRCRIGIDLLSIQQKAKGVGIHTLTRSVGIEYFGHFGVLFDFEEGFFAGLLCVEVGDDGGQ